MDLNRRRPAADRSGRIAGAVFYLAAAVLTSAWYLVAAISAKGSEETPERAERALESAGSFLPVMGLLCMLMGVLELLQSSLDARKGG